MQREIQWALERAVEEIRGDVLARLEAETDTMYKAAARSAQARFNELEDLRERHKRRPSDRLLKQRQNALNRFRKAEGAEQEAHAAREAVAAFVKDVRSELGRLHLDAVCEKESGR